MTASARPSAPEAWLAGPVPGVDDYLQPAAHALVQARGDVERALAPLPADVIWATPPGNAASVGFHARHLANALDRLYTYARGESLTDAQRATLEGEKTPAPDMDAAALIGRVRTAIDRALDQLRATPRDELLAPRKVGRAGLPSTTLGLLFHGAEHSARHTGQIITTAKIVTALRGAR